MRIGSVTLLSALLILNPSVSTAGAILYSLSANYSGLQGLGPNSTLNWSFESPSILTSLTDVTTILSSSIGAGFGSCGSVTDITVNPDSSGLALASAMGATVANWSVPCGPGNAFRGASQFFLQPVTSLGTYDAYNVHGAHIGSLTVAAELNLQGGANTDPILLTAPLVAEVTGTIGGLGTQDYYSFYWAGGMFSATGSVSGTPNSGASYLFSEGTAGNCADGASTTLNSGDSFADTIFVANLAPGQYCVGISANNPNDPTFAINFASPVTGTPEPSGFALLSLGLGMLGLVRQMTRAATGRR